VYTWQVNNYVLLLTNNFLLSLTMQSKISKLATLMKYASLAKAKTGKSHVAQFMELRRFFAGEHKLGMEEYYELEMFDDRAYQGLSTADCIGWRTSAALDKKLNQAYWRAIANDKLLNYALLQHYGFNIPETVAIFSPDGRRIGSETCLRTEDELREFVATSLRYPIFAKPVSAAFGRGTYLLTGFDSASSRFTDVHGNRVPFAEFLKDCTNRFHNGMLFQKCLQPHPDVRAMTGPMTSCVRVILLVHNNRPQVHMAFWKIARAHNITDNFCMGETGNLLAWVDKDSGRIDRVITGLWPDGVEVATHPDTRQTLKGKVLPDWGKAVEMCCAAAINFPGLRLQNWDVAFCEQGPVLMELNTESDLAIPQYLGRTPFINDSIRAALA